MGRDRDPGVKRGGMAGLRRKKGGKAGFENPYCGPSLIFPKFQFSYYFTSLSKDDIVFAN